MQMGAKYRCRKNKVMPFPPKTNTPAAKEDPGEFFKGLMEAMLAGQHQRDSSLLESKLHMAPLRQLFNL